MMIDAGDFDGKEYAAKYAPMHAAPIFPDSSYTPGSSIINYVTNLLGKDVVIDYFLLTHFIPIIMVMFRRPLELPKTDIVLRG